MTEWIRPRGHDVAVLFSRRSRDAYAAEATARGETYTFTDAWGVPRTWLKGEYAYLAPNAASLLLARCNLKHDVCRGSGLDRGAAGRLPRPAHSQRRAISRAETIARIERWLRGPGRRLIVTGKTNLPPRLLGLKSCTPTAVTGYTGWRWLAGLALRRRRVGEALCQRLSGPRGAEGRAGARAAACSPTWSSCTGDLSDAAHGHRDRARVRPSSLTDRTVYIANQVFELIGGMLQAHLNVEAVRHWANADALGRHAAVLPAATDAARSGWALCGRPGCARSAPTTACCRSATTCTACATTPSSTTRSRT